MKNQGTNLKDWLDNFAGWFKTRTEVRSKKTVKLLEHRATTEALLQAIRAERNGLPPAAGGLVVKRVGEAQPGK
ncbi:MAG TPA: hypothetical protein PKC76_09090 [Saprospiraceae bacterium]|nr:hypothetical protein [Saprospiraceae bacterium]HMP24274.1 hypothetical protein [Saprospiraceae bacterium]